MNYNYKTVLISLGLVGNCLQADRISIAGMLHIGKRNITISSLNQRFKDKKPAIFVDFHGVIGLKNTAQGKKLFRSKHLESTGAKVKFIGRGVKTLINPVAFAKMVKLGLKKHKVTESYFNVIKNHGSKKLHKQLIDFANDLYEPNTRLINLLYKLKKAGYRIYLFSNGGYATMQALKSHSGFKHLFEGPDPLFKNNCINTSYEDVYSLAKPSPSAFESALRSTQEDADYAIFIDDTREKLFDWRNKIIQKRFPNYTNFWACSLLYDSERHEVLEEALKKLNVIN